ncbi:MAG: alpha/beta fold hydrolase [Phycisphaeraceae bacterium]
MTGLFWLLLVALLLVWIGAALAVARKLRRPPRKTYATVLGRGLPASPEEIGRVADDLTLRLATGHDTPGWLIAGDAPAGPAVIVLHGFADARYGALTWAPLLLPHASQLLLFDLPGHGECRAPTSALGAREADDVINLLDQIDTTRGVVLFGYSMGAGIAIDALARRDPRLRAAIADGPYRFWHQPIARILHARRWPARPILPLVGAALRLLSPGWRAYDRLEQARQLDRPLLVLHGCRDELCAYDDAKAIADAAAQGQLVTFETGGHLDLAHCDESRYRTALRTFFEQLEDAGDEGVAR